MVELDIARGPPECRREFWKVSVMTHDRRRPSEFAIKVGVASEEVGTPPVSVNCNM